MGGKRGRMLEHSKREFAAWWGAERRGARHSGVGWNAVSSQRLTLTNLVSLQALLEGCDLK